MSTRIDIKATDAAPVGATLMKTGQTTSYRTGDDGDLEAGRATSFTVLASNNPFGNTNRFTDELGTQTYTNNIVIDWSTYNGSNVLGYSLVVNPALISWNSAIDNALVYSIASYTSGWRLPNINEIFNILDHSKNRFCQTGVFDIYNTHNLWSSTTVEGASTQAWIVGFPSTSIAKVLKTTTNTAKYTQVRTFTVTGTILT
jgi:hypothetical protein